MQIYTYFMWALIAGLLLFIQVSPTNGGYAMPVNTISDLEPAIQKLKGDSTIIYDEYNELVNLAGASLSCNIFKTQSSTAGVIEQATLEAWIGDDIGIPLTDIYNLLAMWDWTNATDMDATTVSSLVRDVFLNQWTKGNGGFFNGGANSQEGWLQFKQWLGKSTRFGCSVEPICQNTQNSNPNPSLVILCIFGIPISENPPLPPGLGKQTTLVPLTGQTSSTPPFNPLPIAITWNRAYPNSSKTLYGAVIDMVTGTEGDFETKSIHVNSMWESSIQRLLGCDPARLNWARFKTAVEIDWWGNGSEPLPTTPPPTIARFTVLATSDVPAGQTNAFPNFSEEKLPRKPMAQMFVTRGTPSNELINALDDAQGFELSNLVSVQQIACAHLNFCSNVVHPLRTRERGNYFVVGCTMVGSPKTT